MFSLKSVKTRNRKSIDHEKPAHKKAANGRKLVAQLNNDQSIDRSCSRLKDYERRVAVQ